MEVISKAQEYNLNNLDDGLGNCRLCDEDTITDNDLCCRCEHQEQIDKAPPEDWN
jgi:hypothetical protein